MRNLLIILLTLLCGVCGALDLKENTATKIFCGPFVDFSDGVTPEVAMTATNITCYLYKLTVDGSAPTLTEIDLTASGGDNDFVLITDSNDGMHSLELTAAQLNFKGAIRVSFTDPDVMCPVWEDFSVVDVNYHSILKYGDGPITTDSSEWIDLTSDAATGAAASSSIAYEIGTVTSQYEYVITSGPSINAIRPGDVVRVLNDGDSDNSWATMYCTSYVGSTGTLKVKGPTPGWEIDGDDSLVILIPSPLIYRTFYKLR